MYGSCPFCGHMAKYYMDDNDSFKCDHCGRSRGIGDKQ